MHLCWVKNERVSRLVSCLDYWGISVLLMGCAYAYVSFKYACGPWIVWRYIFTTIIAVCTGIAMWASVQDSITDLKRVVVFVLFSLSCLVPVVTLFFWNDERYTMDPSIGIFWWPVIVNCIATAVFLQRSPEKCSSTGRFDLCGASHQIFHCIVLVVIGLAYYCLIDLYE